MSAALLVEAADPDNPSSGFDDLLDTYLRCALPMAIILCQFGEFLNRFLLRRALSATGVQIEISIELNFCRLQGPERY
jgi:hypothetical protein